MSWKVILGLILLYFGILVLGGLGFHYLESNPEEDGVTLMIQTRERIQEFAASDRCNDPVELEQFIVEILTLYDSGNFSLSNQTTNDWNIPNSMFFAATLASTIGYGNMAPVTRIGRAFCVFYAFVSIPVFLVMMGAVGQSITQMFNKLDRKMDKCKNPKAEKIAKSFRSITTLIIGMGIFMFLPAGAFMYMEGWSYPDSLYYVFITITTVGLGDLVAGTGTGRYENEDTKTSYQLGVALWIIFGLAWLSTVIAMAQDFFQSLVEKVDEKMIQQLKMLNPHMQQLLDGLDDRVLSQMKMSNIQDKLKRMAEEGKNNIRASLDELNEVTTNIPRSGESSTDKSDSKSPVETTTDSSPQEEIPLKHKPPKSPAKVLPPLVMPSTESNGVVAKLAEEEDFSTPKPNPKKFRPRFKRKKKNKVDSYVDKDDIV